MKKSEIKVVAVLAAIVLVLSLAVVFTGKKDEAAPEYLLDVNPNNIEKLDFANGTDYVHLTKENGTWIMSDDASFRVKQDAVEILLSALGKTQVKSRIHMEKQTQLEDFSLLSPGCIIEYKVAGQAHSIRIGTMSAMTEELYISLDEDQGCVYVTTNEMARAFSCRKLDLLAYPDIPTPKDGEQSAVTVGNLYGTTELFREGESWFVRTEEGKRPIDRKTAYNFYFLTWDMHWRGAIEHNAQDMTKYDLARPRISYTLDYTENGEEKSFALELGSSLPDGSCYARIKGEKDVFLLDALMADWLEGTKAEALE